MAKLKLILRPGSGREWCSNNCRYDAEAHCTFFYSFAVGIARLPAARSQVSELSSVADFRRVVSVLHYGDSHFAGIVSAVRRSRAARLVCSSGLLSATVSRVLYLGRGARTSSHAQGGRASGHSGDLVAECTLYSCLSRGRDAGPEPWYRAGLRPKGNSSWHRPASRSGGFCIDDGACCAAAFAEARSSVPAHLLSCGARRPDHQFISCQRSNSFLRGIDLLVRTCLGKFSAHIHHDR